VSPTFTCTFVTAVKVNVGDSWKPVTKVQVNVGDTWKEVFS